MSSTYNPSSTSVDAAPGSRELLDDFHLLSTTSSLEHDLLSPFTHSQTLSNSASPSYNLHSTPGESLSEYSNYQPSELSDIDDEFFGVDFSAGVRRIDSLQSNLQESVAYQTTESSRHPPGAQPHLDARSASETQTTSTYPLTPINSSKQNTPSPYPGSHELKTPATISQFELNNELHNPRYQPLNPYAPVNPDTIQLTPDHSGSSHASAEELEPSTMARPTISPQVTVSQWGTAAPSSQPSDAISAGRQRSTSNANSFRNPAFPAGPQEAVHRDDEGLWTTSMTTGQAGLDPERRKELSDAEVPSLKQQDEQRRLKEKNFEVQEWRSQAGGSSDGEDELPDQSYFNLNGDIWNQQLGPRPAQQDEEDNNIAPVDDAASIRENRLVEGQVYYNPGNGQTNDADRSLMSQPRHWSDAPALPQITRTSFQPQTSNDAIMRWRGNSDAFSLASRVATWGTRRYSDSSVADWDSVVDGSVLKRLSINKPKDDGQARSRQNSRFDEGLDRLANMVRSKSTSKLKRARSTQNIPEEVSHIPEHGRNNSQGTLAPPRHTTSFGRPTTPSLNTAFAVMAAPLTAVGTTHTRHNRAGSVGGTATSPKSPLHLTGFVNSVIKRARSKSDLTSHQEKSTGIASLWRGQGGPPVPNLASPPIENGLEVKQPEVHDHDEDDDDDDDQAEEYDLKIEKQTEPIVPNYEGFKAHVKRLNPELHPRYNWLVSRIAHQQEIRYKNLLELRVKHSQAVSSRSCSAGRHCMAQGGGATLFDGKGNLRESERTATGPLQVVTDLSDDSNPGEGALTNETFPQGVPMPPTGNLPAEFECQLCFKAKKFQKPSDWTKHVHEDVQPFTCTYDKCKEPKSFKRKADWVRHENERHRHLEWWVCQVDDCRHPCFRKDNFLQHLVREHKLPEPKQKTKAAISKARLTEPAWIMLEKCHHETHNKPQDEPCKFCGKSFATWKKLTVHLAKHMEQISLPILQLVRARDVDENTIISPVEQILTPITPTNGRGKMESSSPFNMNSISPHIPMGQQFTSPGFDQPTYYASMGPPIGYTVPTAMPQEVIYNQNSSYQNTYGVHHPTEQPRGFGSIDSSNLGHMDHRAFGSMDSAFSHTKVEQPRGYGSMDSSFSHALPEQTYNSNHTSGYSMPQNYSGSPSMSAYQQPNMLGISDSFAFDPMAVNPNQTFQQVPMSRAQGSASSYGHSPHNAPQNVPYYPPQ